MSSHSNSVYTSIKLQKHRNSSSNSRRVIFLKGTACSLEWLCNYWKVIPQFVPLNSLLYLTNQCIQFSIFTFMFNGSLYGQKIKMSVTFAYSACATGKWYHSIELTESFLLTYRCWTFAKITSSALWKQYWTSGIANSSWLLKYANCKQVRERDLKLAQSPWQAHY